ncbi:hypothetical protein JG536_12445 [Burkholderia ambifaria]|uniref:gamma-mobile-trio protein GmtX n=1 Tax=Burkholderia ambifaria TaxID=152480 RepID=UPI00158C73EE|nr:gamma-mobile-trio protein GmtX [Burkholderia ambifaria]QQJ96422.1 hypothetical protein JG536_12445 [Burkholderia ambifaria]
MRQVKAHAGQVREQAIAQLLSADDIRSATRESMRQIDKACHEIEKRNGELSIKHIVDVMERLYPDNHPAYQSIRNNTPTSSLYRKVIEAWRIYRIAVTAGKGVHVDSPIEADLADSILLAIEPSSTRAAVFAMRAELRTIRGRYQILRQLPREVSPRSEGLLAEKERLKESNANISAADTEVLVAFLDEEESLLRGTRWGEDGEVRGDDGRALSRPGLRDAIQRVLGKANS